MSTYIQNLYQLVFSTKWREPSLDELKRDELYKYIWGVLKHKNCHLYRIGGIEDHIHIITHIHPSIAPAQIIKAIKLSSSKMIKKEHLFPNFSGWQEGYGAFTYHINERERLIEYVKNQKEHHKPIDFIEEYKTILREHKVDFDEKYLL